MTLIAAATQSRNSGPSVKSLATANQGWETSRIGSQNITKRQVLCNGDLFDLKKELCLNF